MLSKFGWQAAGTLATSLLIVGIGTGVQIFLAHGQDMQAMQSLPGQALAPPAEGGSPLQGAGPLQAEGPPESGRPINTAGPLQGADPIQAAFPPLAADNGPFQQPPNFGKQVPNDLVALGCSSNDRLATIMGAPRPPNREVLGMLVRNLKNPCAETSPPPRELTVVVAIVPGSATTTPVTVPPRSLQIVALPPVVYSPTCQSQASQNNC